MKNPIINFYPLIRSSDGSEEFHNKPRLSNPSFGRYWKIKISTLLSALQAVFKNHKINVDPFFRPSGGSEEFQKKFQHSNPPFGRPWRIPKSTSTLTSALWAVLKNSKINFDTLIRPSGSLEEFQNKYLIESRSLYKNKNLAKTFESLLYTQVADTAIYQPLYWWFKLKN